MKPPEIIQITCTTGIATTYYDRTLKPITVHKWSGLDDGRYDASEVINLLRTSPHHIGTKERIQKTDVLLIDEISMLSKKMFEQIDKICSDIRECDTGTYFGGLQVILVGDFYQLPPVANKVYNEPGDFCFSSPVFENLAHTVTLRTIVRQNESILIDVINKLSRGAVDDCVLSFMKEVERPLKENSIKLFSNNFLVDTFNRQQLLESPGDVIEFQSADDGNQKCLSQITAPHTVWLKTGCPVILLRNLSDVLVNGLRGIVIRFEADGPIVEFPTVPLTTTIKRYTFSGT